MGSTEDSSGVQTTREELTERTTVSFIPVEKSLNGNFSRDFANYGEHGLLRTDPGGFLQTEEFSRHAEKISRFQLRKDDIWIVTFPKCGTTWTQELVWMLMNNCDTDRAKIPQPFRSPFLEFPYMVSPELTPPELKNMVMTIEKIDEMSSPRVIKSHLPFYLLPPNLMDTSKVVYVARNPKDVIVSFFFHHKLMKFHQFNGDIEAFAQYFMDDELLFSPFFPHILDAWGKRSNPNMLFLFYEDLKKDLRGEINKVAAFLHQSPTEDQLTRLLEHLKFENFAKNDAVNNEMPKKSGLMNLDGHFIRKGRVGDWKNHFNPELNKRIDEWIAKHLADTNLKFISEYQE